MSNPFSSQYQIAEDQLDRLEILLEDPVFQNDALRLDEIQGFLCAVLSGPSPMAEEDWLAEVLGSEEALETDAGREAADILRRFALALEAGLEAGEPPVLLLYPKEEEDDSSDYLPWCQAYLSGVDASSEDWFDFLTSKNQKEESEETSYLDERLFSFLVLSGDAESAALEEDEAWPDGEELEELESECQEDLSQAVLDIYKFWANLPGAEASTPTSSKKERDNACPCGSEKPFKACCGK